MIAVLFKALARYRAAPEASEVSAASEDSESSAASGSITTRRRMSKLRPDASVWYVHDAGSLRSQRRESKT